MFGVTTPLVTQLVEALADRFDPLVFHATGTGGRSMEKLVESGLITAVLDMTTTEIADLVVGGVFPAGPERLDVIAATGVPYVGSCGALDMVNFGALATVPERFDGRRLHVHNPEVTLMRTTVDENVAFGELIAGKLNACDGPVRFLLPEGGVSLIDAPGQPFWDPDGRRRTVRHDRATGRPDGATPGRAGGRQHQRSRLRGGGAGGVRGGDQRRERCASRVRELLGALSRDMIDRRVPIVGGGAGTGLSAKWEEAGGIDLIVIYNSGRYRMAGRGSLAGLLAYGNANEIVVDMAREVLPVVRHTPVLAGVNGTDPFYLPRPFLAELARLGFAGVQNFPTVGLIDGVFRQNLEETGMGYGLEVEMIALAHELDLLTTPYVFSAADAVAMTEAGADIIVCHMGLTTGGSIGAETARDLDDVRRRHRRVDRCRARGAARRHRALPRRPDRRARRRRVRAPAGRPPARVLRRVEHGAPPRRAGAQVPDRRVQGGDVPVSTSLNAVLRCERRGASRGVTNSGCVAGERNERRLVPWPICT